MTCSQLTPWCLLPIIILARSVVDSYIFKTLWHRLESLAPCAMLAISRMNRSFCLYNITAVVHASAGFV
eukprot:6192559-Amphidinium_carterae.1